MTRDRFTNSRSFKKGWIIFALLCGGLFLFHKPLLLVGCKVALKTAIPHAPGRVVSYDGVQWEGDQIVISGLSVEDGSSEWRVDRIEFLPRFSALSFQPKVTVVHPQIILNSVNDNAAPALAFLYRSKLFAPQWEIKSGVLQLPSKNRFYFLMAPGQGQDEMGRFTLSYDPEATLLPLFTGDLSMKEGGLHMAFQLHETDLGSLLPLTALIVPDVRREWEMATGEIDLEGEIALDSSFHMRSLHFFGSTRRLALASRAIGIDVACEECQGSFSYPSSNEGAFFWDKLSAALEIRSANCSVDAPLAAEPFGIKNIEGQIKWEPQQEPEMALAGMLVKGQGQFPFSLNGKGSLQQNDTFWSVIEGQCHAPSGATMQVLLSLCRHEADQDVVQLKIDHATAEHIELLSAFYAIPAQCKEGSADAEATWIYQKGICKRVSIDNCHLNQMRWHFPKEKLSAVIDRAYGDCVFEHSLKGDWKIDSLHLKAEAVDCFDSFYNFKEISAQCTIYQGIVQSSQLKGKWGELEGGISFPGPDSDSLAEIFLLGNAGSHFFSFLPSVAVGSYPVDLRASLTKEEGPFLAVVEGSVCNEPVTGQLQFSLPAEMGIPQFVGGEFKAEKLSPECYAPFLPLFLPGMHLAGHLKCAAQFTTEKLSLTLGGEDLLVQHPWIELQIPSLDGSLAEFTCDLSSGQWKGTLPIFDGKIYYPALQLPLESVETKLFFEGNQIKTPAIYAECEGLAVRGSLQLLFKGKEEIEIALSTSQIAGSAQNFTAAMRHFRSLPKINLPLEGSFTSGDRGFILNATLNAPDVEPVWSFNGEFRDLGFPLNDATRISDASCAIGFDSQKKRFHVEKGEGKWHLKDGTPFTVSIGRFTSDFENDPQLEFAVKVAEGRREISHFEGKAIKNSSAEWSVSFDLKNTHFAGTPLNISRCVLNDSLQLISFEMKPIFKCEDLARHAHFFQNAGILSSSFSPVNLEEWQLEGTMQAHLSSEDIAKGFSFRAESRDLKVKGRPWKGFHLSGQKIGEKWLIEKLEGPGMALKGAFVVDLNGFTAEQFQGSWEGVHMKGSGYLRTEQKRFSCKFDALRGDLGSLPLDLPSNVKGSFSGRGHLTGDYSDLKELLVLNGELFTTVEMQLPFPSILAMTKAAKFSFSPSTGFVCHELDLQCKSRFSDIILGSAQVESASHSEGKWQLTQMKVRANPFLIDQLRSANIVPESASSVAFEEDFELIGDLTWGEEGHLFQGSLKPGTYGFGGRFLSFEQLQCRFEKSLLSLKAKTRIGPAPLWALLQMDISQEPFGVLKLFDDPKADGLKLLFITQNGKLIWENAQGSCYGVHCQLAKNTRRKDPLATLLTGEITVDAGPLAVIFPEALQSLKLGTGYKWEGDLTLWQEASRSFQLRGKIQGREFEALGYRMKRMEGILEATPEKIQLSQLQIEDDAGVIGIKKIEISKEEEWFLSIPHILVRELQPSLLRKTDGGSGPLKPFIIKDFFLKDLKGSLKDLSTLEASGKLTFTNQSKKESSFLDIPMEVIKNIGLDPGLLTPIGGELEIELRGDKFYLLSLNNAFSEGSRSEFYLAPSRDLSYVDLGGKVHIDLRLRQEVVLKLVEPFILTIRGTLEKPRYGLQY